jgi:hypothetical protein
MANGPTSLADLRKHAFLAKRVDALAIALMTTPDDAALWIGAGLSAKYSGLPTWTHFLRQLLEEHIPRDSKDFQLIASLLDSGRLAIAAECMQDVAGARVRDELVATMKGASGRLPEEFGYLGVRDVVTTNYDLVLESSLRGYQSVLPSSGLARLLSNDFKIVKIHGSVAQPDSCVLSLSHYVRAYNVNLTWYLTNVFSTCSVVFFGSSMNPSEPYFDVLRILRASGRMKGQHYAVVAVESSASAKVLGQRLQDFGIELIPYVPDEHHTFIDELLHLIDSHRGSTESMRRRLAIVRTDLDRGRSFRAALRLWHASHADIPKMSDRQVLADVVSEFFLVVLGKANGAAATGLVEQCLSSGIDLPQMMNRTLDLIGNSSRTVNAFYKLQGTFPKLEIASRTKLPLLARKFKELGEKIAEAERARIEAAQRGRLPS